MNSLKQLFYSLNHRIRYRTIKPILELIEIYFGYLFVPEIKETSPKNFPKIAFIKQDVYQDLYNCASDSTPQQLLLSTFMRSGIIGLFTKFNAHFLIIKTEDDPECNIWQEKMYDCKQEAIEYYRSFQEQHALYSKSCHEIDWNQYDIVISIDISVPARITKQYPQLLWCYLIPEPCMTSYSQSKIKPIDGYDLFLNVKFRNLLFAQGLANHEVEFPYYIQYYPCFNEILGIENSNHEKKGIVLEHTWSRIITDAEMAQLAKFGPIRQRSKDLVKDQYTIENKDLFLNLMQSKYCIMVKSTRGIGGNSAIEAIASGCLFLGNPLYLVHKSLLTPQTVVYNFEDLLSKLEYLEKNDKIYQRELQRQRKLLNYICFFRPIKDLLNKGNKILKKRNINQVLDIS